MKKIGDLFDVGGQLCRIYNISCEPLPWWGRKRITVPDAGLWNVNMVRLRIIAGTDDPDRIEFRIGPTTELGAMIGGWPLARAGDPVLYAGMPYKTKEYLELLKGNP